MSAIREKLTAKVESALNRVESAMKSQLHLQNPTSIIVEIESVENLSSILNEDDREFISAVRYAIDKQIGWEQ